MLRAKAFLFFVFFFNDTATTEIYTLSLRDALPISICLVGTASRALQADLEPNRQTDRDRKSTRLNSSHDQISYAVFCLTKNDLAHEARAAVTGEALAAGIAGQHGVQ